MVRQLWITALIAVAPAVASAGTFDKGPYLQNVSQSSITIMWETSSSAPFRVVIEGDEERAIDVEADEVHEVVVDGLQPETRYHYRVEAQGGEVSRGEFATAPEAGVPFSFVVFGDSRSNANAHQVVVERIRREVPDLIVGTGDMVNDGSSDGDWQKFFDIERDLLRENVLFPSVGNHDRQGRGRTADTFRKYFSLPENGYDPERYYAFTYSNARFLILDSNSYSFALADQTAWIEEQLQAARMDDSIQHIFVSMHHPPYSISLHGGQEELREAWTPLFEKYQVSAVFSGHDHVYSRAERNGVNYFVSGGGGAPLYPRKSSSAAIDKKATRFFERVNHYLRVHVVAGHVEVAAIRADGTVIETLTWGEEVTVDEALAALQQRKTARELARRAAEGPQASATGAPRPSSRNEQRGGLGLLGILGAGAALLAALWAVWTLRS